MADERDAAAGPVTATAVVDVSDCLYTVDGHYFVRIHDLATLTGLRLPELVMTGSGNLVPRHLLPSAVSSPGDVMTSSTGTRLTSIAPALTTHTKDKVTFAETDKHAQELEGAVARLAQKASALAQAAEDRGDAIDAMLARIRDTISRHQYLGSV